MKIGYREVEGVEFACQVYQVRCLSKSRQKLRRTLKRAHWGTDLCVFEAKLTLPQTEVSLALGSQLHKMA